MSHSGIALASGVPRQELGQFSERVLIPLIHFVLLGFLPMHAMRRTPWPSMSAGCGQLFIARRDAYEQCGGHAMLRDSLHDGIKLPRVFRRAGFRTDLFDATDLDQSLMKLFMLSLLVILPALSQSLPGEPPKPLVRAPACTELREQYDAPQRLAFPATNVVVLTIADRKGSDQIDGWVAALKSRYAGRIELRGLADVGDVPGLLRGKVHKKFHETRPYPVMMDWLDAAANPPCATIARMPSGILDSVEQNCLPSLN